MEHYTKEYKRNIQKHFTLSPRLFSKATELITQVLTIVSPNSNAEILLI